MQRDGSARGVKTRDGLRVRGPEEAAAGIGGQNGRGVRPGAQQYSAVGGAEVSLAVDVCLRVEHLVRDVRGGGKHVRASLREIRMEGDALNVPVEKDEQRFV